MKLDTALDIGRDCGLETVGEAILNIEMHVGQFFIYSEIAKEMGELYDECIERDVKGKDLIKDVIIEENV